jgi:beta-lactamase regulating signal transducer with metallopeptidase domain
MMPATLVADPAVFLAQLAILAVRVLALASIAGLGLVVFRVKAAALRLFTWTAVLYAALAMPLLGRILPAFHVRAPAILEMQQSQPVRDKLMHSAILDASISSQATRRSVVQKPQKSADTGQFTATFSAPETRSDGLSAFSSIRWFLIAMLVYFAGALFLLARLVVGFFFTRRLLRASLRIPDSRLSKRLASRAAALRLAAIPDAAESELISVPLTLGVLHPAILLPAHWREWADAALDAVVAHELSHVARRDALTQQLSMLHRAIFWFSPLAWWLNRHLADLAEQASDEAALDCGADRNEYATTLLGFFEALQAAPGRVWWQGVSMAKTGRAERRVERILAWKEAKGAVTMKLQKYGLKKSIVLAIVLIAVPAVFLAASVEPSRQTSEVPTPQPPAPPKLAGAPATLPLAPALAPVTPLAPLSPVMDLAPIGPPPNSHLAPVARLAPVAPLPPASALAGQSAMSASHGHSQMFNYYDDEQRFVIVSGKSDSLTMSGTTDDAEHVQRLKKQIPGDFIWFEHDEKSYIIRDQATIERARKFWAPQEELGRKQEELGKRQEVLGKQQEELGRQQEQVHVKVPDMTAELDKLRAELQQLNTQGATMEQMGDIQSEIGELQSKIGELQSHAGDEQSELGERQSVLGEQQGKLGEQQGELGRQQGELGEKASRQMKQLLDDAIKNGTAQLEPQTSGGGGATL